MVAIAAIACLAAACAWYAPAEPHVAIHDLGDDVFAAIRTEPLSLAVNANSLFIVTDSGVVVVDAQFTRVATLENLAALRRITRKPVRYVINTHWHDDHVAGNQVYQDSFPGVRFLAHAGTRADLIGMGRQNRADQVRYAPAAADRYERLLDAGLGTDSTTASPSEAAAVRSALTIIRQYVAENDGHREILPDTITGSHQKLVTGGRTIELHWFGRGNTRGDVVVYLPRERVLATGDLLVAPIPFAFNAYPGEWIAVLDSVAALGGAVLVPGHGPVMRDLEYLHTVRSALTAAREEARAAAGRGATVEAVLDAVTLESFRAAMAGHDKWLNTMFQMFFRGPVVRRSYEEAERGRLE